MFLKMKAIKFLFVLMFCAGICQAQEEWMIPADRPGNTWGAEVMYHHKLSWENGVRYERSDEETTLTLNSMILRYGLFENVELRVGTDFLMTDEGSGLEGFKVAPLTVGTKIKCYEGEGWIPSVAVLAELISPHVGSKDLLAPDIASDLYLLLEQPICDYLSLCHNAGLEWDGESATPTTFLALGAWFSFTDTFGGVLETNNYLHPDGNQYLTEFGLYWLPTNKVQLSLSAGLDFGNLKGIHNFCLDLSWMVN